MNDEQTVPYKEYVLLHIGVLWSGRRGGHVEAHSMSTFPMALFP